MKAFVNLAGQMYDVCLIRNATKFKRALAIFHQDKPWGIEFELDQRPNFWMIGASFFRVGSFYEHSITSYYATEKECDQIIQEIEDKKKFIFDYYQSRFLQYKQTQSKTQDEPNES